ncbi:hypothetical protein OS493_021997 [Desmophyllum pertusum]|uniref:Death domain-containing protein n=1 Tax=Desmophyllum pertusum TaxID=174260 RepID=A0A9W9YYS4_9CNID|nr:hypothetical protein OS493_021997 [Desmophyllum pertusum]
MNVKHRDILRRHWSSLRDGLELKKLLPHLVDVLDVEDVQEVKAEAAPGDRIDKLLEILPMKGPAAFDNFVKALTKIQPYLDAPLIQESVEDLRDRCHELGIALNLKKAEVCNIGVDYTYSREKARAVLWTWMEQKGRDTTIGRLTVAMYKIGKKALQKRCLACGEGGGNEDVGTATDWSVVLDLAVHHFEAIWIDDADVVDIYQRVAQQLVQASRASNGFRLALVQLLTKLAPKNVEHLFGRGAFAGCFDGYPRVLRNRPDIVVVCLDHSHTWSGHPLDSYFIFNHVFTFEAKSPCCERSKCQTSWIW